MDAVPFCSTRANKFSKYDVTPAVEWQADSDAQICTKCGLQVRVRTLPIRCYVYHLHFGPTLGSLLSWCDVTTADTAGACSATIARPHVASY